MAEINVIISILLDTSCDLLRGASFRQNVESMWSLHEAEKVNGQSKIPTA